ncbi:MAG: ABC-2 family transporter protein, partial [Planctomycetota bacterium]
MALIGTNLKAAFALRGAFWMQVAFMCLNNLIFFTFWWLAFRQVDSIGGWRLPEMCVLYGICASAFGLASVLFGGVRDLSRTISDGQLDLLLTQPKSVLFQSIAGRCYPSGWGDLISAAVLFGWSGYLHGWNWLLIPTLIAGATIALTATGVLIHSLAFWAGPV